MIMVLIFFLFTGKYNVQTKINIEGCSFEMRNIRWNLDYKKY